MKKFDYSLEINTPSLFFILCLFTFCTYAQIGIGTNTPTNMLHVTNATDPIRLEGFQAEVLTNINEVNSPTTTSEILLTNSLGVFKKIKPEYIDTECYMAINEFLKDDEITIPSSGSYNGEQFVIIPIEYDGFIIESVTYRVMTIGSNFTVGLAKNSNGVISDLLLSTSTIGGTYTITVTGGALSASGGDAIYLTMTGTSPITPPKGLSCIIRLVKP